MGARLRSVPARAIVFDFDGTIVDTELPTYRAWAETYERYGCRLDVEEWAACVGTRGGFDPIATLAARATCALPPEADIRRAKQARAAELLDDAPARPGVLAWLDEAEAGGLAVGIASSSPAHWVEQHLHRLGLRHRFACLACCEDDEGALAAKPDPGTYRDACRRLGADPRHAIAVEDSPHGIAAARAAGLFCIAVPNAITSGLDLGQADLVVASLADLSLADALRRAAAAA